MCLKTLQLTLAAAIPVLAVAASGQGLRLTTSLLGALIGIIEGILQLSQTQQNWLLYRATREALKNEDMMHAGGVGPYASVALPHAMFVERCAAIMSGEHSKWLTTQKQAIFSKQDATPR